MGGDQINVVPPDAFNCNGCPTTIIVSRPAKAFTFGRTVTTTVSRPGFGHPNTSLADKTYDVVPLGDATGFSIVALFSVEAGVQKNEEPTILPFNCAVELKQISVSMPALAIGYGTTVTVTLSVALQLPIKEVNWYVVVIEGLAIGFTMLGLFKFVAGVHKNFSPSVVAPNWMGSFAQIVVSALAFNVTLFTTRTLTESRLRQPFSSNTT